jgi:SAM-dependent methyltransferase
MRANEVYNESPNRHHLITEFEDSISRQDFYKLTISVYTNHTFTQLYAARLFPQRRPPVRSAIDKFLDTLPKGGFILDLGCGTGKDVAYLRANSFQAFGIDISAPMIQIAKDATGGGYFIKCDFHNLSCFRPSTFDGILCLASLQHVFRSDTGEILQSTSRLLRKNGSILIITKEGHGLYMDNRLGEAYIRPTTLFTYEELQSHLVKQGFSVLNRSSFCLEREGRGDNWLAILARRI